MTRQTYKVEVEVTAEIAPGLPSLYSNEALADDLREVIFDAVREDPDLDSVVMTVTAAPELRKVWVATVEAEPWQNPAVYVSNSLSGVLKAVRAGQGCPEDYDEVKEWLREQGRKFYWDSYYVEEG